MPNFAAVANSDYLSANASPDFLRKQFPNIHTWNAFAYDYLVGHEGWNTFKAKMKDRDPQFATRRLRLRHRVRSQRIACR